jgi:archaellum component FlaF (FlaF/FlaG flagellin family)
VDSILPALLALSVLILASLTLGRSSVTSFSVLGDAWHDAEERSLDRVRTEVGITAVAVNGADVDVTLSNTGATPLVDFSRMDVVVQYTASGTNYIKYVDFTTESLPQPDDTWRVLSVSDDVVDPGVLNTGESLNIRITLNPAVGAGSHWLQVTTELGVSAATFFTN